VRRTRRFARRQRSWFGRDPRIHWLQAEDPADLVEPLAAMLGAGA
jgi:tRNA dimethylallyltransferase